MTVAIVWLASSGAEVVTLNLLLGKHSNLSTDSLPSMTGSKVSHDPS